MVRSFNESTNEHNQARPPLKDHKLHGRRKLIELDFFFGDLGKASSSQETSSRWCSFFKGAQKVIYPEGDYSESFLNVLDNVEAILNSSHANSNLRGPTSILHVNQRLSR